MKRWLVVALAAAAMALVPTAVAAEGGEQGQSGQHGDGNRAVFGPYSSGSLDSGTCGNSWATDTYKRVFYVQQTGASTWRVTEAFVGGHFVTIAGQSPAACETTPHTTNMIKTGVTGRFGGIFVIPVTGGSYTPSGCNIPTACNTTAGFMLAVFGKTAYDVTSFFFDYRASGQGLIHNHWVNASADLGGNHGDIASS